MRLLVITSSFPRHDGDFSGLFVRDFCRALVARGHEVEVLAWRGEGAAPGAEPGLRWSFIPYGPPSLETLFFGSGAPENLRGAPLRAGLVPPALATMVAAALARTSRGDIDGVVGHWLVPGGIVARLVGGLRGIPSLVVGHSGGVHLLDRLPRPLGAPLARWLAMGPTTVPTEPLRAKLEALGARGIELAPMGFTPPSADRRQEAPSAPLRVGFLGRLVDLKDLPTLLEARALLAADGVPIRLEVVGDGPLRDQWQRRAPSVPFLGARLGEEKDALLSSWDVLAQPSRRRASGRHEGLPVTILEAAARGTVPLVSGVPGVEPWIADPALQVLPSEDPQAWAGALKTLAELSAPQWGELREATRAAVAPLSWPTQAPRWEAFFCPPSRPGL